jgi:asparagine synthase (glutamine-hydrolysing)
MCGIGGIVRPGPGPDVDESALRRMAAAVRHRGPDGFGFALDPGAGLVSTRLAIFDIPGGWQPLASPGRGDLLVYNGEIYNHPELRADLERNGIRFSTRCDTEVLLRLLERDGLDALDRLNGQFAFAWWQPGERRLTMARDRFGVRPLHYAVLGDGTLVFGSEAKAIFASGELDPEADLLGVDDTFTLWGPRAPRTAFAGISQVPPGGIVVWERGELRQDRRWWRPEPGAAAGSGDGGATLEELLRDSVRLRLRADVPVGTYLSGGLDSSLITALAREETGGDLRSFSVAFHHADYDERPHQERVAGELGTIHHVLEVGYAEIAAGLPEAIRHAERPLVRTAPVPLLLLANEVRAAGGTVVATGEGADELFWGYDLFKEVVLRELHGHDPERAIEMIDDLYPYLGGGRRGPAWRQALLEAGEPGDPLSSHISRAAATEAVRAFYAAPIRERLASDPPLDRLRAELPRGFGDWSPLDRAAWLELTTLLEPYLLSAQADRVSMAHGVEGRFPFLDHRVFGLAAELPAESKLAGLEDKVALRELAARLLPPEIASRPKQPYRAPEVAPFFAPGAPDWVEDLLSPAALGETGFWDPERVAGLVRRCRAGRATGVREGMALVGILSTQLWCREFLRGGTAPAAETAEPRVRIDRRDARPGRGTEETPDG